MDAESSGSFCLLGKSYKRALPRAMTKLTVPEEVLPLEVQGKAAPDTPLTDSCAS